MILVWNSTPYNWKLNDGSLFQYFIKNYPVDLKILQRRLLQYES